MIVEPKPLTEITHHAITLLYQELGIVDTMRFLNQFTNGYGNYTEERHAFYDGKTLDELLSAVKQKPQL